MGRMEMPLVVPVSSTSTRTSVSLREVAIWAAVFTFVIFIGWSALHDLVLAPQEQKAAFVEVTGSSTEQLSAKSVDELVTLETRLYDYAKSTPAMRYAADDEANRVDRALSGKRGDKL
jgi:hypothetical protein